MTAISAPWIAPPSEGGSALWTIPLATLMLLFPFYFVSVWSERLVIEHMLPVSTAEVVCDGEVSESVLQIAVRNANLVSYGFLLVITICWLIGALVH